MKNDDPMQPSDDSRNAIEVSKSHFTPYRKGQRIANENIKSASRWASVYGPVNEYAPMLTVHYCAPVRCHGEWSINAATNEPGHSCNYNAKPLLHNGKAACDAAAAAIQQKKSVASDLDGVGTASEQAQNNKRERAELIK